MCWRGRGAAQTRHPGRAGKEGKRYDSATESIRDCPFGPFHLGASGVSKGALHSCQPLCWLWLVRSRLVRPVLGPGYYGPVPYTGNVKIHTELKGASVYVDGGFAGLTGKLKKFPLRPGNHNIELRDSDGRTIYQQQVAVIAGKTTDIHVKATVVCTS